MKKELKLQNEDLKLNVESIQEDKFTISGVAVILGEKSRNCSMIVVPI